MINNKLENNVQLTSKDIQKLTDYNTMKNVLSFFPHHSITNQMLIEQFCKANNINTEINKSILKKSFYELYIKICFIIENNLPIIDENKNINEIMYMSDINIQEKYNTTIKDLILKYISGEENSNEVSQIKIIK